MSQSPKILEKLVFLTQTRDIEGLESNLLEVLDELFAPERSLLVGLDRHDVVRFIKSYSGQKGLSVCTHPAEASAQTQEAVKALYAARQRHAPSSLHSANGDYLLAFPLLDTAPWKLGLVMAFCRSDSLYDQDLIAGVLHVYCNFCLIIDESQRDQLTGLLNRRTFDENIHRVIQQVTQYNKQYAEHERRVHLQPTPTTERLSHWLGIIDIDFFKKINDTFGHLYGDEVLLLVAQLLRDTFRDTDLIYRFGGEEFVVITTNADQHGSCTAFERFRHNIARHDFPQVGHITISFGAVEVSSSSIAHTLLDQADQALYYAKENGRNQGHFYETLVGQGCIKPVEDKMGDIELFD